MPPNDPAAVAQTVPVSLPQVPEVPDDLEETEITLSDYGIYATYRRGEEEKLIKLDASYIAKAVEIMLSQLANTSHLRNLWPQMGPVFSVEEDSSSESEQSEEDELPDLEEPDNNQNV